MIRRSASCGYAQELRVGIGVDVSVGFFVEELAEVFGVDEVAVDTHRDSERRVNVEGLGLRSVSVVSVVHGMLVVAHTQKRYPW